jgi:hypothetical protein
LWFGYLENKPEPRSLQYALFDINIRFFDYPNGLSGYILQFETSKPYCSSIPCCEVATLQSTLTSDVPFVPTQRTFSDAKLYLFALVFATGNLLLPMAVHSIPNGGLIFLPLFFFTLVAAYSEGLNTGLLVAVASPLFNHALTGMPSMTMLPVVMIKSLFIAVAATFLARHLGRISLPAIAALVVAMQTLGAFLEWGLTGSLVQATHTVTLGIPGMLLMTLGGYALLRFIANLRGNGTAR